MASNSTNRDLQQARILAEILLVQCWAGGEAISADRIYGLMHGFESVMRQENTPAIITEELQEQVEDILEQVEEGTQTCDGPALKDRLRKDGIEEEVAERVMQLCRLQERFTDGIDKIAGGQGTVFQQLSRSHSPERDWLGAIHYMELIDCTEDAPKKMHAVFAAGIPRVGELVTPQGGQQMRVVEVEHVTMTQSELKGLEKTCLVPHIHLEAVSEDE